MCPRLRQIADHDIAQIAAHVLATGGPDRFTFAEVSKRCGLAPATLVQRFGTRDALLVAAIEYVTRALPSVFADTSGLIPALQRTAPAARVLMFPAYAPATAAALAGFSLELRKQISYSLTRMMDRGELPRCDVAQLARSLQLAFVGAVAVAAMEGVDPMSTISAAIEVELSSYV